MGRVSPPSPNDRLVAALRALGPVEAQNRLMRLSDREIALSMMYMGDRDRGALLALLPAPKAERINSEMRLHRRLVIRYDQYVTAVESVLSSLEQQRRGTFRSYLRPRRSDRPR